MEKNDFDDLHKQINRWCFKPTTILLSPVAYQVITLNQITAIYRDILKRKGRVVSCEQIGPNKYELFISSSWGGCYVLEPKSESEEV
jgi:hypothetical protein